MTREPNDDTDSSLSRRTFMKAASVTAGAAAPGVGASGSAAAAGELDSRLLNWRRVEAKKVWDRGYRGRPDRTLAITDSGISGRHPDLGPWNGVVASKDGDSLKLADVDGQDVDFPAPDAEVEITELATLSGSGTVGPGAADAGVVDRDVIVAFTPSEEAGDADLEATRLTGTLTWTPSDRTTSSSSRRRSAESGRRSDRASISTRRPAPARASRSTVPTRTHSTGSSSRRTSTPAPSTSSRVPSRADRGSRLPTSTSARTRTSTPSRTSITTPTATIRSTR